ncbi:MAG: DsbA family protein [Candidatus Doudnabacteria bacterium]|jgi:protein-disulfide isomerase
MKKIITITIVVLLVLGFGFFLFKISPQEQLAQTQTAGDFDLSGVKKITEPAPVTTDDRILGNINAKNTLLAYEDYQCPSCALTADTFKQMSEQLPDTKFVFRYFPLYQIHPNAVVSAYAAEAAGEQGKYWEMHNLLFKKQNDWSSLVDPLDYFVGLAKEAGVANLEQFKTAITSKKFKDRIQKDLVESLGLSVPGTPTIYFNGKVIKNDSLENMKKEAEQYLSK